MIQIHEFAIVQNKPPLFVWVADSRSGLPKEALFDEITAQVLEEVVGGRLGKRDLKVTELDCSDGGVPVDDVLVIDIN